MQYALVLSLLACLLLVTAFADNLATTCVNAQLNIVGQQDLICDIDSPFCVYVRVTEKRCAYCAVMQSRPTYGGSCNCDPTSSYCDQSNDASGLCNPYTKINQACIADSDCETTTQRRLQDGSTVVTLVNEQLFCVNGGCKPCNPTEWAAQIGTLGVATLTCPGFNAQISANIGRYATTSRFSGASYTCNANGDFVWTNQTVDYNYQYSCGDRAQWPADCSGSPTPSAGPASSTTPSAGATSDATAAETVVLSAITLITAMIILFA